MRESLYLKRLHCRQKSSGTSIQGRLSILFRESYNSMIYKIVNTLSNPYRRCWAPPHTYITTQVMCNGSHIWSNAIYTYLRHWLTQGVRRSDWLPPYPACTHRTISAIFEDTDNSQHNPFLLSFAEMMLIGWRSKAISLARRYREEVSWFTWRGSYRPPLSINRAKEELQGTFKTSLLRNRGLKDLSSLPRCRKPDASGDQVWTNTGIL